MERAGQRQGSSRYGECCGAQGGESTNAAVRVQSYAFGGSTALAASDFHASAVLERAATCDYANYKVVCVLSSDGRALLKAATNLQFRLYLDYGTNNDNKTDIVQFWGGNSGIPPVLTVVSGYAGDSIGQEPYFLQPGTTNAIPTGSSSNTITSHAVTSLSAGQLAGVVVGVSLGCVLIGVAIITVTIQRRMPASAAGKGGKGDNPDTNAASQSRSSTSHQADKRTASPQRQTSGVHSAAITQPSPHRTPQMQSNPVASPVVRSGQPQVITSTAANTGAAAQLTSPVTIAHMESPRSNRIAKKAAHRRDSAYDDKHKHRDRRGVEPPHRPDRSPEKERLMPLAAGGDRNPERNHRHGEGDMRASHSRSPTHRHHHHHFRSPHGDCRHVYV